MTIGSSASAYLRFVATHRRLLAFGFLLTFFSSLGQTFMIALSGGEIRAAFGLTNGGFGGIYSAATLSSALCLPWAGRWIDRVALPRYAIAVCLGLAAACLLMAASAHVAVLAMALFGLRLCGQGLMTHTAMTGLARGAGAGRGKAVSIGALGFSAGEVVFPPLIVLAMTAIGWRATWAVLAALLLAVGPAAVRLLLRGDAGRDGGGGGRPSAMASPAGITTAGVLRDPRFLLLLPALVTPAFVVTGVSFHQVALVEARGWSLAWFASSIAGFALATIVSSLAAGPAADRLGAQRLAPVLLLPLTAGVLALGFGRGEGAALAFMVLAGLTAGTNSVVINAVWVDLYGAASLGMTRSLAASLMVVSSAASPVLFGVLLDLGVSFEALFLGCAAWTLVACAAAAASLRVGAARAGAGG